jgi:hypothetical protein
MSKCNMISLDLLSGCWIFHAGLAASGFPGPRCCGWSGLITQLWHSVQGEVLQSFVGKDEGLGKPKRN